MAKIYFLGLLLLILAIPDAWTLFPYSEELIHPFIFNKDQGITVGSWVWIAGMKLMPLIFAHILAIEVPRYRFEIKVFFLLSFGYYIDYLILYNARIGTFHSIPVAYTTFMLFGFSLLIIFNLYKYMRNG